MSLALSTDGAYCLITSEQAKDTVTVVNGLQLQELIDSLATVRGKIPPAVAQLQSPLEDSHPETDCTSPRYDLAVVEGTQPLVLLAIAFPQLGWRTVSLTPREAGELGMKLLTLSATR